MAFLYCKCVFLCAGSETLGGGWLAAPCFWGVWGSTACLGDHRAGVGINGKTAFIGWCPYHRGGHLMWDIRLLVPLAEPVSHRSSWFHTHFQKLSTALDHWGQGWHGKWISSLGNFCQNTVAWHWKRKHFRGHRDPRNVRSELSGACLFTSWFSPVVKCWKWLSSWSV